MVVSFADVPEGGSRERPWGVSLVDGKEAQGMVGDWSPFFLEDPGIRIVTGKLDNVARALQGRTWRIILDRCQEAVEALSDQISSVKSDAWIEMLLQAGSGQPIVDADEDTTPPCAAEAAVEAGAEVEAGTLEGFGIGAPGDDEPESPRSPKPDWMLRKVDANLRPAPKRIIRVLAARSTKKTAWNVPPVAESERGPSDADFDDEQRGQPPLQDLAEAAEAGHLTAGISARLQRQQQFNARPQPSFATQVRDTIARKRSFACETEAPTKRAKILPSGGPMQPISAARSKESSSSRVGARSGSGSSTQHPAVRRVVARGSISRGGPGPTPLTALQQQRIQPSARGDGQRRPASSAATRRTRSPVRRVVARSGVSQVSSRNGNASNSQRNNSRSSRGSSQSSPQSAEAQVIPRWYRDGRPRRGLGSSSLKPSRNFPFFQAADTEVIPAWHRQVFSL